MPSPGIFGFDFGRFGRKKAAEAAGRPEPAPPPESRFAVGQANLKDDVDRITAALAGQPDPGPEPADAVRAAGHYVPASISGDGSGFPLEALSAQRAQDNAAFFGSPEGEPRYESMEHYHAAGAPNGTGGTLHINADGHLRGLPGGHPLLAGGPTDEIVEDRPGGVQLLYGRDRAAGPVPPAELGLERSPAAVTPEEARHAEAMRLAKADRMRLAREDLERQARARAQGASSMTGAENADAAAGLHGGDA